MHTVQLKCFGMGIISTLLLNTVALAASNKDRVEQGLRTKVHFKGKPRVRFSILDRMKYYDVPGVSIAVVDKGKIAWAKGYGTKNVSEDDPVTKETLFQSGSISKAIASLGVLSLVEKGILDLDRNVNDYLKSWKIAENKWTKEQKVTLRRLLSHSAGLNVSGFPGYPQGQALPRLDAILMGTKPEVNTDPIQAIATPGQSWRYSGGGFTIIQKIIEDFSGKPFPVFMRETVLLPLDMLHSTYEQPLPDTMHPSASKGHLANGKEVPGGWNNYPEMAAAGLWTTPSDLAKAIIAIEECAFRKKSNLIQPDLCKKMLTEQMKPSGLGVMVKNIAGDHFFSHGGMDHGFVANWQGRVSENGKILQGLVIMTNSYNGLPLIDELISSVADIYEWKGFASIEKAIVAIDPLKIKSYSGTYQSAQDSKDKVEFSQVGQSLFCKYGSETKPMEFFPESDSQFFSIQGGTFQFKGDQAIFKGSEDGEPKVFVR